MSNFETIDLALLVTATGGAGETPNQSYGDEVPPQRTWSQMGREYGAACLQGAGQSLIFGGRPRSVRDGLTNAAMGCAMGVGMKAVDDLSRTVSGE
jgi:hypothetical protein